MGPRPVQHPNLAYIDDSSGTAGFEAFDPVAESSWSMRPLPGY
jgi:hypothetical protein